MGWIRQENLDDGADTFDAVYILNVNGGYRRLFLNTSLELCDCRRLSSDWFLLIYLVGPTLRDWRLVHWRCATFGFAKDFFNISNVSDFRELDKADFQMESGLRCPPKFAFETKQHVENSNQILFRESTSAFR